MSANSQKSVTEKVVTEAWNNPAFKAALIENPEEAIRSLTGQQVKLPEGKDRMVVVDQTDPRAFYFNLPVQVDMDDVELTEEQLEVVAGGGRVNFIDVFKVPIIRCFPSPSGSVPGSPGPTLPFDSNSFKA
jgi:hypothetical protein